MKKFPFGLDREGINKQFDAISRGLHNGDVIPQAVTYAENQVNDDFIIRTVSLTFAMRVDKENSDDELE